MRGLKAALYTGLGLLCVFGAAVALAETVGLFGVPVQHNFENDYDTKAWSEVSTQIPPPPLKQNLVSFYVSAATEHRFFLDPASISIGQDGVVRYTVVIETSGGASNINFEGMRCQTREWRHYASGHRGVGWSKTRNTTWRPIREEAANRHRAALFSDFFCPEGVIANDREIKAALRQEPNRAR